MQVVESSCVLLSVSNKIFGVLLSAYIEGLRLSISYSTDRASCGDVSCFASYYDHNFANISLQFAPPSSSLVDKLQKVESKNGVHLYLVAELSTDLPIASDIVHQGEAAEVDRNMGISA